jgi:hypothetical protein
VRESAEDGGAGEPEPAAADVLVLDQEPELPVGTTGLEDGGIEADDGTDAVEITAEGEMSGEAAGEASTASDV